MSAVESTDVSCGSVARLKNQENLRKLAVREDVGFVPVERPYSLTVWRLLSDRLARKDGGNTPYGTGTAPQYDSTVLLVRYYNSKI